jgi:alpha-2-macroglobulin
VSVTRPLLHIGPLLTAADPDYLKNANISEKFMAGVNRILSMQTVDGGFAYWPGQTKNTYWGTAYATHVLLEGLDQGYPIPKERVDEALDFIERTLTNNPNLVDPKYGYSVAKSEPYMQYVLARAGRGRKARLRALIKSPPQSEYAELFEENLFLLKAALFLSGDRTYERSLQAAATKPVENKRTNGWSFWSALRMKGLMLNLLEDLFPGSQPGELLSRKIVNKLRTGQQSHHFTTQDLSWTVSGLGKRASAPGQWKSVQLSGEGKVLQPLPKKASAKGADETWQVDGASGIKDLAVRINNLEGTAYAILTTEGVKPGVPYDVGDHTLAVSRRLMTPEGTTLSNQIDLGDLVFVELTLKNQSSKRIQNVVLLDRFAAGLEVENPRLGRSRGADFISGDLWETDYMDIRDDRIALFGHVDKGKTVKVYYALRATVAGRFHTPPVEATAMYDPEKWSRKEGDVLTIIDPWGVAADSK